MLVIPRLNYSPSHDLAEGDLVTLNCVDDDEIGIVLKVAIILRNDDHLTLSEEVLVAEVYMGGTIYVFDEEELDIIAKCNFKQHIV